MAVLDEMAPANPVHLDGRKGLAAPLGQRQVHPAGPQPVGCGPEPPVEVPPSVERADDRVQRDRLQAEVALTAPAQRAHHLIQ